VQTDWKARRRLTFFLKLLKGRKSSSINIRQQRSRAEIMVYVKLPLSKIKINFVCVVALFSVFFASHFKVEVPMNYKAVGFFGSGAS